ncbi:GNAT family N-acetyltransferase [Streptomyces anulatus]|uniref:GNAT family N-acetyltransferase n=1 Tax=Streptomyces TaxID=1883 RepID=UPI00067BF534|nr:MULTISPECIES: GNAT family N-acetyltransferase [Streptomyces]KND24859.1 aminoglycoside 2'-N-acetyltransferase [Streptomyces europaeiscabiei]MDF9806872.1 aminoglycoside 2'-N-acetyltransferase I [Streptomyces sp. HB372]KPL32729.1 aminoglycoside 2'-N-acetyltransferase [Streptomyces anulatus]MBT1101593.1 GNAT family N-acetyltransferase [Streptomyces sp. Tu10]OKI81956.1 aminoglycoside 2'-N-acetyltransferase [Streptomyces sp. TSRI0395]
MDRSPALRIAHTSELTASERGRIRELLDTAFEGNFAEEDWEHSLGGIHALVCDAGGGPIAHGSLVQRRVLHGDRSYRAGYVEAVAVRADHRREGHGHRVMAALEHIVDTAYDFGALSASDAGAPLYTARGWQVWPGRLAALGPAGPVPLPEEEGTTYVRPAAGRPLPEPGHPLQFDWREGDLL